MNLVKRMVKQIRKSLGVGKKQKQTLKKNKVQKAGAVYGFDLNDKIGGQAANVGLNGTPDGDCPAGNPKDLGMTNYGAATGGKRKTNKSNKRNNSNKSNKRNSSNKLTKKKSSNKSNKRNRLNKSNKSNKSNTLHKRNKKNNNKRNNNSYKNKRS